MLETYLITEQGTETGLEASPETVSKAGEHGLLWVDLREYDDKEIQNLADSFSFHPVTVESCLDDYRRPHLWEFENYFYINLTTIEHSSPNKELKVSELHIFAGKNFIVTACRNKSSEAVDRALKEMNSAPGESHRGTLYAVYLLTEDLVETYFPTVERLDSNADKLEDIMFNRPDKNTLKHLFTLKRRGQELRRLLGPQRDVFSELARRDFPFMVGDNRIYFQDSYNRIVHIFDMLDTIREVLSAALDVYLSSVSNRLNQVMKILTIVSTVMMALAFITGFFGMNFIHLPWLRSPYAFRNMVAAMLGLTVIMLYGFRRKGWL